MYLMFKGFGRQEVVCTVRSDPRLVYTISTLWKGDSQMSATLAHDVVTAAINLAPHIHALRDELEATRHVPQPLAEALVAGGTLATLPPTISRWIREPAADGFSCH